PCPPPPSPSTPPDRGQALARHTVVALVAHRFPYEAAGSRRRPLEGMGHGVAVDESAEALDRFAPPHRRAPDGLMLVTESVDARNRGPERREAELPRDRFDLGRGAAARKGE